MKFKKNDIRYNNCTLLLAGDFNARAGASVNYVLDDSDKCIPVLKYCEVEFFMSDKLCKKRTNEDKKVNSSGKQLLDLCAV